MTEETPWLSKEEADAWLGLVALVQLLGPSLDSQLEHDSGLTFFEFVTLAQLAEAPDRTLPLSELAVATNSPLPRLSRVITRLEKEGLVTRTVAAHDARSRDVALTAAGWDTLATSSPGHIAHVHRLFVSRLTPAQITALTEITDTLVDGLDPRRLTLKETRRGSAGRPGLSRAP